MQHPISVSIRSDGEDRVLHNVNEALIPWVFKDAHLPALALIGYDTQHQKFCLILENIEGL